MRWRLKSLTQSIRNGVRSDGLRYFVRIPGNELRHPRLSLTRFVRRAAAAIGGTGGDAGAAPPMDCLLFAFDLGASPITFDFCTFLAGAEIERRRRGLAGVFVLFIPGTTTDIRQEQADYEAAIGPELRRWRVRHMLIPILSLLPTVRGYVVCPDRATAAHLLRDTARVFPDDFRTWLPRQPVKRVVHDHARQGGTVWPMLKATDRARELAQQFLDSTCGGKRAIVITLRHSASSSSRNSRIAEWALFVSGLDRSRFVPIFVHDAEARPGDVPASLAAEIFCDAARWNLEFRMALYDAAWLNLAIMHGPMELCWYNERARYIVFLEVGAHPTSSAHAIAEGGQPVGSDLTFATPCQRIVWQGDYASVIKSAFDDMLSRLDS